MRGNKVFKGLTVVLGFALSIVMMGKPGAAQTETILHTFNNHGSQGYAPGASLIFDTAGNLYGTTPSGGAFGAGTVFELLPQTGGSWIGKFLHSFNPAAGDGTGPGNLIIDASGNLYGVTSAGGAHNYGTVFELIPQAGGAWHERLLHSFNNNGTDGYVPVAGLVLDAAGDLYGVTADGGTSIGCGSPNCGTVFELIPHSGGAWAEKILTDFADDGFGGYSPAASLIFDAHGNLYGTTNFGGAATTDWGTVFELTPTARGKWTETVLHSFSDNDGDGYFVISGVVFDSLGNLYGTTYQGGDFGGGTVFELSPSGGGVWTETLLHSFAFGTGDADLPLYGPLVFDAAGNLYGTTQEGGATNNGAVFELTPAAGGIWTETLPVQFNGTDGESPASGLILDGDGNLYGTTPGGGPRNDGLVYRITP
jgi:uncharacterized repeat protein (TIGR03803 family)